MQPLAPAGESLVRSSLCPGTGKPISTSLLLAAAPASWLLEAPFLLGLAHIPCLAVSCGQVIRESPCWGAVQEGCRL